MDKRMRGFLWCVALAASLLGGCKREGDATQAAVASAPTQIERKQQFQQDMEGVWATQRQRGDDAETIFTIEWSASEQGLRILHDGNWLSGTLDDVDLGNHRLAWHAVSETGPEETLTFRKVPDERNPEAFSLEVTWQNGQSESLGFVRRLTERDRAMIATAIAEARRSAAMGDGPEKSPACEGAHNTLRLEMICNDQNFAMADRRLVLRYEEVRAKQPDADKTIAAAERQLDACKTQKCLRDAYDAWETYMDDAFELPSGVE